MSAQSVTSWQSGFPPRTSFAPTPPPEALAVPTVILGLEAPRPPRSPEGSCLLPNGTVVTAEPGQFRVNGDCSVTGARQIYQRRHV